LQRVAKQCWNKRGCAGENQGSDDLFRRKCEMPGISNASFRRADLFQISMHAPCLLAKSDAARRCGV
jgi:hypothetical protein